MRAQLRVIFAVVAFACLLPSLAQAQPYEEPPPPPPPPPSAYAPPPPPPNARYYAAPPHRLPPPWIRPKFIRGTLGLSVFGTIVANQDGGVEYLEHGGGLSFWAGVEIGRVVGIEGKYTGSFHNPAETCANGIAYSWCDASYLTVQTIALDLKLHIPTNTRFVPYVEVGPMGGWIGRQGYLADARGGGFEAGGGFDIWFSRHGTVGFEALYRGLAMSDYGTFTGTNTYLSLVQLGGTLAAHF